MSDLKKIIKKGRVIILIILLIFAIITIHPNPWAKGVAIRSVEKDSAAYLAGIFNPEPKDKPMFREVITKINGKIINDVEDYEKTIINLEEGDIINLETLSNYEKNGDKRSYSFFKKKKEHTLIVKPLIKITELNETEEIRINKTIEVNETLENGSIELVTKEIEEVITVPKTLEEVIGVEDLGFTVYDAPQTNLKKGLDLEGGTRVLLQPEIEVSQDDMEIIIANLKQRLNVYGLSDIVVKEAGDFISGNKYIIVEVAGANEDDVKDLIGRQGKFEAKVGNTTVFRGGSDVKNVCRTPQCSFPIDHRRPCGPIGDGVYQCSFSFGVTLDIEAAERQAEATKDLEIIEEGGDKFLSKNIDLYLDDELVESLRIGAGLRGKAETDIAISGPGAGNSLQEARLDTVKNMKSMQTVLITGSLPVKLNIEKIDTVSPALGKEFVNNALLVGLFAILAVIFVVSMRYKKVKIALPMLITMLGEVTLILGFATLVNWQLDLAAIAAIIVAVGTGVDDQIVITDETLKSKGDLYLNWKEKLKRAFFIIMAAYFTTVVAMLPLLTAGAGLLKGFALTTIAGVTFGVFVTRPAFAAMIEVLFKN
ncbi:hypothetical protein HN695_06080 [Candidatus Woesearchaeota archaeon]|jgi:preprotein translocase subunit SecD|nr:hypothetical protein [Candidatus Woesearchaeota archaeon]MBT5272686.1 hypothetical protein [Candidatus Woesearchaeota archaeon]MBT6040297.1 hypothetical protein [Candidatus Woesearchaeota archaeon]MBT6337069.1 hypothetical protein [Candidatus Woesearchaeota archaeon]MBT7927877.1 hypothetical protein [Candidatus Woesearchaeota archaeon]